ncbi:putative extracellular nuclease [Natronocella acetinitrilica]|uniref:Extracellular nuclease n=1 Tax=Natronocella acetinitrilica TaxID=414046 RepID=A0AAE3KGM0_9GAMM|nr:ExeM/NucH family extracellular endonuclease [Natronocella acetinitrilica]MCP1675352.1 putative extracellular nuclease [Natronocella acetinitrilica]
MQGSTAARLTPLIWPAALFLSFLGYLAFGQPSAQARCEVALETPIAQVSGLSGRAPEDGQRLRTGGIVTGVFLGRTALDGFFLQSDDGDDPAGLFVYAPGLSDSQRDLVQPGHRLQLSGRRGTWRDQPQLQRIDEILVCGNPGKPAPVAIELPVAEEALDALFGVLVHFPEALTVTGNFELGRYGALSVAAERLFRSRSDEPADGVEQLLLDDGSYTTNPDPVPYLDPDTATRRTGDRVSGVRGVLVHQFDAWRLHPVREPIFHAVNPRPAPPSPPPDDVLRVAASNVENYFLTLGRRGADSEAALERQRGRLLPALSGLDADLLGLVELENDSAAVVDLKHRLNAISDRPYRGLDSLPDMGRDAITMGFLYRPDRLELLGEAMSDTDPVHHRPPLVAAFQPTGGGEPFLAAVVHFKSKVGCPRSGDVDRGEGCWNERRLAQARALADFVAEQAERLGIKQLLLLGDFNSYAAEAPIRYLEERGLVNLIRHELPAERQYTYVFRGASGTLDYVLANAPARQRVESVGIWNINADEPPYLAYDRRGGARAELQGSPFRSSDHDPVYVDLKR